MHNEGAGCYSPSRMFLSHVTTCESEGRETLDESRLSAEIFETDLSVVTTPFSFSKNAAGIRLCGVIFSVAVIRP